nr:immunoglobulin light chain junction region [Macaca mulatta]
CLQESNCSYSF